MTESDQPRSPTIVSLLSRRRGPGSEPPRAGGSEKARLAAGVISPWGEAGGLLQLLMEEAE